MLLCDLTDIAQPPLGSISAVCLCRLDVEKGRNLEHGWAIIQVYSLKDTEVFTQHLTY